MRFAVGPLILLLTACALAQQADPPSMPAESAGRTADGTASQRSSSQPAPGRPETSPPAGTTSAGPPDAPSSSSSNADPVQPAIPVSKQQPKRILGVMPNFRAVSAGAIPPPPTPKQALEIATQNSFDYSSFIFVGVTSLMAEATDAHPQLGKGIGGYGEYYWRGLVDKTDGNYWVIFILPTILHQDGRYFAMGEGGFWKRGWYAASRVAVTRNYEGQSTFNASEIFGRGIAQAISISYYPSQDQTAGKIMKKYGFALGRDALTQMFREFWPDIATHILHRNP